MTSFEEMFGVQKGLLTNFAIEDIDFGAEEEETYSPKHPDKKSKGKVEFKNISIF